MRKIRKMMESCSHTEYRQSFYLTLHSEGLLFHGPPYLILLLLPRLPLLLVHKPLLGNLAVEKRRRVKTEARGYHESLQGTATCRNSPALAGARCQCGTNPLAQRNHAREPRAGWRHSLQRSARGSTHQNGVSPLHKQPGDSLPGLFASDNNVLVYRQSSNGKYEEVLMSRSQICWDQAEKSQWNVV